MLFGTQSYYVDCISPTDIYDIMNVYNSNVDFLKTHLDKEQITLAWITDELSSTADMGFKTYKIVQAYSNAVMGVIDIKIDPIESYLSLLMLHESFKNQGLGKNIYQNLEFYIKSCGSNVIRIDVVTHHNDKVLGFWKNLGFSKACDVVMNWSGKELSAACMKKPI